MMLTTYAYEFQLPYGRTKNDNLSYYLKRKGRRHFNLLKEELPVLKEYEEGLFEPSNRTAKPQRKANSHRIHDKQDKKLQRKNHLQLLNEIEWSSVALVGGMVRPRLLPAITTKEVEKVRRLFEETQMASNGAVGVERRKRLGGTSTEKAAPTFEFAGTANVMPQATSEKKKTEDKEKEATEEKHLLFGKKYRRHEDRNKNRCRGLF